MVFVLGQALALFDHYTVHSAQWDAQLERQFSAMKPRSLIWASLWPPGERGAIDTDRYPTSSSFSAASMNALSGGLTPKAAACPQIEGIGRNTAFGICATSSSLSRTRK